MKETFSPKQVARALNASESSLKRWCDQGRITTVRTAGGHRRITLPAILSFLRESQHEIASPELIGLPPLTNAGDRSLALTRSHFSAGLARGDEPACRSAIVELFLAGRSLTEICDDVIASAMCEIGLQWEHGTLDVYQERVACGICSRVIDDCRGYLLDPSSQAPVAIGGTASGDPYTLATHMAELVLRESHWNATSLGANLPFPTFLAAILAKRPKLLWLSISYVPNVEQFVDDYLALYESLPIGLPLVIGGKALDESLRSRLKFFACCDNMQQLKVLASTLIANTASNGQQERKS